MFTEPGHLRHSGIERVVVWMSLRATEPDQDAAVDDWLQQALTRIEVAGAGLLSVVGAAIVCGFDSVELEDALDLCLASCAEAAGRKPALDLCCGVAIGEVRTGEGRGPIAVRFSGACIDAARALAEHGGPGQVVLDPLAHEQASDQFLFSSAFTLGGREGAIIDRAHPRRRDCRAAARALRAPIVVEGARSEFERLQRFLAAPGPQRVIFESESRFQVLDWLARLQAELRPSTLVRLQQQASGLQPLGGLQVAVRGLFPDDTALAGSGLAEAPLRTARALLVGDRVTRPEAVGLLEALCAPVDGARAWLMLDRVHDVDAASLGVVAEVLARSELDLVAILGVAPGAQVPAALTAGGAINQCSVWPLSAPDAQALAAAVLGLPDDSPVARRVASLGGAITLGVLEAARTLVVSGDLVPGESGFAWRTGPRTGGGSVPVDALFSERVQGLDPDAFRMLEVLSIAPSGADLALATEVALADGMSATATETALGALRDEGIVDAHGRLGADEVSIRNAMRNGMPPARAAELHRFVATSLRTRGAGALGAALLAYHLGEGGLEKEAAVALLQAASDTSDAGFNRMAVRLAAVAVQFDDSEAIKRRAHRLASGLPGSSRPASKPAPGGATDQPAPAPDEEGSANMAERAIRRAVDSLKAAELEDVDDWLDTAMVAGWDPAATHRLRALSQLARGDQAGAIHTLQQAHVPAGSAASSSREAVCWALLHLGAGEVEEALCAALEALATARRAGDSDGAGSALHLMAACYQAVDRPEDAARLRAAAEA